MSLLEKSKKNGNVILILSLVILNEVKNLIKSILYETLRFAQGDKGRAQGDKRELGLFASLRSEGLLSEVTKRVFSSSLVNF